MNAATYAQQLPYIDEHASILAVGIEDAWTALLSVLERGFSLDVARWIARVLGCAEVEAAGPRPLDCGSTIPGFHVASAQPPSELALAGRHRFSSYALIFRLEQLSHERTRVRAETRAAFPGLKGRLYRALVIGTRGHAIITRGLLAGVGRRAGRMGEG